MKDGKRCVLIVDDDTKIVRGIGDLLKSRGYAVLTAYDGQAALDQHYAYNAEIDIILLDVMMPICDGLSVLTALRQQHAATPVIMLTARSEEYDQLQGFSYGADDYIPKPFSPSILLARMEAVLKRTQAPIDCDLASGSLKMNPVMRSCLCDGVALELTKREFDLLYFLMQHPAAIFTRAQLLDQVWGYDYIGEQRTVDTHIKQLRMKLGTHADCIKTVHRVGYKFET